MESAKTAFVYDQIDIEDLETIIELVLIEASKPQKPRQRDKIGTSTAWSRLMDKAIGPSNHYEIWDEGFLLESVRR